MGLEDDKYGGLAVINLEVGRMKIAIIGFGRFGKLFAELLLPYGEVFVVSSKKIEDDRFTQIELSEISDCDWVIPCTPISTLEEVLKSITPHLKKGALVMDVCSVKVLPCQWLENTLPAETEIIGTHPMFGPDSARNGLAGLQMVICPLRQSSETLENIKNIFGGIMGLKIIETTPEDHDRQAAKSLSLVHFIGRGLGEMKISKQEISTLGFERLLTVNETVNNDTWQLFLDMQKYNPFAKEARKEFINALTEVEKKIEES